MQVLTADPLLSTATEVRGHKVLAPCVLLERVGEGGMGVVYHGIHLNLGIEVAVKIVPPDRAADDPTFVKRFQGEARSAARINHQNVVRVYDVENCGELHYLIMEYVPGEDAAQRVRRKGPLAVNEALQIVREASLGLAAAHHEGIVHRDIKPGNLLISARGHVKVCDLGLAKPVSASPESMISMAGAAVGTPAFMPPEQWEGKVSPATDVWAMGSTLYYLLTGKLAFAGDSVIEVMRQIAMQPFPDVRELRTDVSEAVLELLQKATQQAPGERFADAGALAAAIASLDVPSGAITDVQTDVGERPTMTSLPTRAWLDEVKALVSSTGGGSSTRAPASEQLTVATPTGAEANKVVVIDEQLQARRFGKFLLMAAIAAVCSAAVGAIGGFMVWDANQGRRIPAWTLLVPLLAALIAFMVPVYILRRRWFLDKQAIQAGLDAWKRARQR